MDYEEIKRRDREFLQKRANNAVSNGLYTASPKLNEDLKEYTYKTKKNIKDDYKIKLVIIITAVVAAVLGALAIGVALNRGNDSSLADKEENQIKMITPSTPEATAKQQTPEVTPAQKSMRGTKSAIPESVMNSMLGKSYPKNGNAKISLNDLVYLTIPYIDFNGETVTDGHLIVAKELADEVLDIFAELYEAGYPIEKMRLVDEYGGSDYNSIDDNNTSSFNYRESTKEKGELSPHALGRAIDINPQINPYVRSDGTGAHSNAREFWKRIPSEWSDVTARDAYIGPDTKIYDIFISHGWSWGGNWSEYHDYQHFEKTEK